MAGFGGPMDDMAPWLARKYQIMQQQADAGTLTANAGMVSAQARANLENQNAKQVAPLARSAIGLQGAQAENQKADAALTTSKKTTVDQLNKFALPEWLGSMGLKVPGTTQPPATGMATGGFSLGNGLSTVTGATPSAMQPVKPDDLFRTNSIIGTMGMP